jgi:hypothetical protein
LQYSLVSQFINSKLLFIVIIIIHRDSYKYNINKYSLETIKPSLIEHMHDSMLYKINEVSELDLDLDIELDNGYRFWFNGHWNRFRINHRGILIVILT